MAEISANPPSVKNLPTRPRVVVVGGGFAGLSAGMALADMPVDVTLIDRRNHHTFQPLLYQVALAVLSPADIAQPIRSIFSKKRNIEVLMDEVTGLQPDNHRVLLGSGAKVEYDYLILGTGSTHSYFGKDQWAANAPGLKTVEDATEIRRRVLLAFELAEREMVETGAHPALNFVVIGGGPTGVELAGAISDISKLYMRHDFRHIDPAKARVILIEGSPRILAAYPEDLSKKAVKQLEQLGVEVHAGQSVMDVQPGYVVVGGKRIDAVVTLWAAGVQASPLAKMLGCETDRRGCGVVDIYLNPPGHPEIFLCGDLAHVEEGGRQVPGVAQPAMQMGRHAAKMIAQDMAGKPRTKFHYFDKGDMATIGRQAAVANLRWPFKAHWSGSLAWLSWATVHLFFLVGFRNRFAVFFSWAWTYLTFNRGARLITGSPILPGWGEQEGIRPQVMRAPMDTTSPFVGLASPPYVEEPKPAAK
jgi:NADH dehydrogenase